MKRYIHIYTLFGLLLFPPALHANVIPVDGQAARVNQRVITVGEVLAALQPMERELRATYSGRELALRLETAYEQVLRSMIERALILEEFEQLEAQIPPQLVDQHIQGIIADNFDGDRGEFVRQLALEGISMEEWREDTRDRIAVMMRRSEEITPLVVVAPRQIRNAYEERADEFTQEAQTRVRMITIPRSGTNSAATARHVWEQARDGADFAELARTHSEDTRAKDGGDWGWIDPSILRTDLARAVESLEEGAISELIETEEAFHLLKVEGRREASMTPFSEVRDELAGEIRQAEEERLYQAWINRLRARHHVQRFELEQEHLPN